MSATHTTSPVPPWTAEELRHLPAAERDAILRAAATRADDLYRNDKHLTDFNASGEEDLHGDSSNTESR
jgi:hypothetical protein